MVLLAVLLLVIAVAVGLPLSSWRLVSSEHAPSAALTSVPSFDASSWSAVQVPCTVFGTMAPADIYRGLNLAKVNSSVFSVPWLFRSLFHSDVSGPALLTLRGVAFSSHVFVNGARVGSTLGTFAYHDLPFVAAAGSNAVTVAVTRGRDAVFPDEHNNATDLDLTFIDWSPSPPDNNMGLIRPVDVHLPSSSSSSLSVLLRYPSLDTKLVNGGADASVVVSVELFNFGPSAVRVGPLRASLLSSSATLSSVVVQPGTPLLVSFPAIFLPKPTLWWPWHMETGPFLTPLTVSCPNITTSLQVQVGIRQITSALDASGYRFYSVNNRRFSVRGAGWANELFLRNQAEWAETHIELARQAGLNTIRLEGQLLNDEIFEYADRRGMFVIPGISCCDAWQHWSYWTKETLDVAVRSVASQVRRIRYHACALAFWYSSDELPPKHVEAAYLEVFRAEHWPNPLLASASNLTSSLTGIATGVKMSGPYQWVPPLYWLTSNASSSDDGMQGGAFGFLSEGGPGAAPMTFQNLQAAIADLWPVDNADWMYHYANPAGYFGKKDHFTPALNGRYGSSSDARQYSRKAQVASYESYRAYFEAYTLRGASFVTWMLQNGRPQNQWHLIEYGYALGGAYFGAKKAASLPGSVHAMLDPRSNNVSVYCAAPFSNNRFSLRVSVFSASEAEPVWTHSQTVTVSGERLENIVSVPTSESEMRFVELVSLDANDENNVLDRNVYWLSPSSRQDELDWTSGDDYTMLSYADFSQLDALVPASLEVLSSTFSSGHSQVHFANTGKTVAFFVRVRFVAVSGQDVLPAVWSDNFVTLFAGQSITVSASHGNQTAARVILEPFNQ